MKKPPRGAPARGAGAGRPTGKERGATWAALLFFLRFVALWLGALLAVAWIPGIETVAIRNTVWALSGVMGLLARDTQVAGAVVSAGGARFDIVADCTPLMPTIVLTAALLAFPARWRWRLAGILGGAAALWIYNQIRIVALFVAIWRWPQAFEFVHVYLWQTFTLIVVFLLFVAWLRLQSQAATAAFAGRRSGNPERLGPGSAIASEVTRR